MVESNVNQWGQQACHNQGDRDTTDDGGHHIQPSSEFATMRLEHQAQQVKTGEKPDNFLDPSALSDFERSHLRDAFVVVKTMQSAVSSGKGTLG